MKTLTPSVIKKKLEAKGLGEVEINAILTSMEKIHQTIVTYKHNETVAIPAGKPCWLFVKSHCPSCQAVGTEKVEGILVTRNGGTIFSRHTNKGIDMSTITRKKSITNYCLCSWCMRREQVVTDISRVTRTSHANIVKFEKLMEKEKEEKDNGI